VLEFESRSPNHSPDPSSPIVVCAADNNYAMQLAVVAKSALEHLQRDRTLLLYVIDGGITGSSKQKILRSIDPQRCVVTWLQPNLELLTEVPVFGHFNFTTYLRLLIPDLLPETIQKVIYLDSDLVVNADLGQLWDLSIADQYLLAVQQTSIPYVSSASGLANYEALGISPDCKYFNGGVLVINLEKWRQEKVGLQALNYILEYKEQIRFADQDGMNATLAGRWGELDPRWNQTPDIFKFASWQESPFTEEVFNQLLTDPYIIHFASAAKPWNSREIYPANDLFFQYVDQTAWAGWRFTRWRRLWRRVNRETQKFVPRLKAS
jgi:lipopolysaccharide biosynthesis glycosyltransferase